MPSAKRASESIAEEALVHLDALYNFVRYLSGSDAEAEDLVQETYARALSKDSQFELGTNLRAWLFRILRNAFLDGRRRAKVSPIVAGADVLDSSVGPDPERELLRGDAELELLRGVVADDIAGALLALSPDARAIVLLDLEGLTETELAEVLGCALGTVKSRLARARAALRESLCDYARG
jgi:RNA polymerase sigma-70 factor (ECF subfamily)